MCPRCKKNTYNTYTINRYGNRVPVNKCKVCGYLWIKDEDMIDMAVKDVKRLFIDDLANYGKRASGKK